MSGTSRIVAAVAAGYFLGRFKKLGLALMIGSALADKNLRSSGLGLLEQGRNSLASSPEAKKLGEQVTSQLMEAGKAAAVATASSRIDRLSESLNERASQFRDVGDSASGMAEEPPPGKGRRAESEPEEPEDEYEDEYEEEGEEEPEDEYEDEEGEEEGEEEPEDEYDEEEEVEEPEDEYDEEEGEEEEPEEAPRPERRPTQRPTRRTSRRRRRSASPAGRDYPR